jgi:hypothetical protein
MLSQGSVWLTLLLNVGAALIPDLILKVVENLMNAHKITKQKLVETSRLSEHYSKNIGRKDEEFERTDIRPDWDKEQTTADIFIRPKSEKDNKLRVFTISAGKNRVNSTKVSEELLQVTDYFTEPVQNNAKSEANLNEISSDSFILPRHEK